MSDKRFKKQDHSLGGTAVMLAGFNPFNDPRVGLHPKAQPQTHATFRQYYNEYQKGDDLDREAHVPWRACTVSLLEYTVASTDVFFTTVFHAADTIVSEHLEPDVVLIDESKRPAEADMWQLTADYPNAVFIMFGDPFQMGP